MSAPERKPVDVLAVMGGLRDLARHRLTMKRRDFDRMAAAGKEPNVLESIKAERAEYLVQQADDARAAVAELIEAARTITFHVANFDDPEAHVCEVPRREMDALFAALAGIGGAK